MGNLPKFKHLSAAACFVVGAILGCIHKAVVPLPEIVRSLAAFLLVLSAVIELAFYFRLLDEPQPRKNRHGYKKSRRL